MLDCKWEEPMGPMVLGSDAEGRRFALEMHSARCPIISTNRLQSLRPSTSNHLALFRLASDLINMGAGPRYPYPKEVWTPAGGWWTRPNNWVSNTAVCAVGIALATYGVWTYSADREWRHNAPTKPIPSMNWARQFKEGELSVKEP